MTQSLITPFPTSSQKYAAEMMGSGFLAATVVGSGIMAEALAGGNVAIALLGNTLATGAILVVLITIFGPISGAHFNPIVTMVFHLRKEITTADSVAFIVAQVVGMVLGVWIVHTMFGQPILQLSTKVRAGPAQGLAELVASFGLLVTILMTVRHKPDFVPVSVGLYITAAYWFTASTSFANPAITIARSLTNSFSGIEPIDAPLFIGAQIIGALLGMVYCGWQLKM